nr:unnamed protein product [Digitaria exilis]
MDSNGFSDPYVKLQLGKQRFKTKVIKMNLNPTWDQEFSFLVGDIKDVLKLDVYDEDILKMDDFLGQLRVPLEDVLAADDLSLGAKWYQLLPKGKPDKAVDCGEICVSISLESAGATRSWSDDLAVEAKIFEFDAMDDPPSVMTVHAYDFDGPFDEVTSLGHAEINFVKSNLSELADVWVPLKGNLAQSWQSKLHLRIFLNNSKGTGMVTEYLSKMEKEVDDIEVSSDQYCIPGALLSASRRISHQQFYLLFEKKIAHTGRGMDAKHGAKSMDNGKLKFCLQSFASFGVAHRTIMALWKARSLSTELKVQLAEEQYQTNTLQSEDSGIFVGIEDDKGLQMTEVFSSTISNNMASLMEVFEGGSLEMKLHIKYQIEDLAPKQRASSVQVSLGIEWSKFTRHQKRIEKNVLSSSSARLKEMFNLASKELSHAK